jgi:hypothetical protein
VKLTNTGFWSTDFISEIFFLFFENIIGNFWEFLFLSQISQILLVSIHFSKWKNDRIYGKTAGLGFASMR